MLRSLLVAAVLGAAHALASEYPACNETEVEMVRDAVAKALPKMQLALNPLVDGGQVRTSDGKSSEWDRYFPGCDASLVKAIYGAMFNSTATPTCIPPGDEACGVSSPFIGLHYREDAQAFCPAFFRWASTFAGNGTCCSSGSSSSSSSSSNFAVNDAGSGSSNGNNNSSCSAPSQLPISEPWMPDLVAMQWLAATVNLHQIGINGSVSPANASSAPTSAINPNVSIPQIVIESSTETFGGAGVDGSVNATMPIYLSVISSSTYTTFESYVGGTAQEPGHDNFLVQWLIDPYRMYAQALWADYPQGECKTGEA